MALAKAKIREILSAAGIDSEHMSEAVNSITEGHTASIEALREEIATLKTENSTYKAEAERLKGVEQKYNDLQEQVKAEAKEREGKDYDKLKEEFDNYKTEQEAKATRAAKEKAFRELLSDMKVSDKGVKAILKWQGVDGINLDDDGKITDASALRKSIKEDWGDYIQTTQTHGAGAATPPANNGGGSGKTKADIMKIKNASERQQAILENPGLFGLPSND